MNMPTKIFLIGMPGSGKTFWAKRLSAHLGFECIDTDSNIALREGSSIATIFQEKGEAYFRDLEARELERICTQPQSVIVATGGGLPCFFNQIDKMNECGETIFLDVPMDVLCERILREQHRPMFLGMDAEEVKNQLEALWLSRGDYYLKSKQHIPYGLKMEDRLLSWIENGF